MNLTLLHPQWLYLLPLCGIAGWWWQRHGASRPAPRLSLVHPALGNLPQPAQRREGGGAGWWHALALALLLVALARPQSVGDWILPPPEGREVVLLVDVSASMASGDFQHEGQRVARLDVLKGLVSRFVQARAGDHFALIAFASQAATFVPMTPDRDLVVRMLQRLRVGIAGEDTAIGDALALALKQIRKTAGPRPALILFSDGDNTAGEVSPGEALGLARRMGVAIYGVTVNATLPPEDAGGGDREPSLRELAELSGGRYYQAGDSAALEAVVGDIDRLEKTTPPPPRQRERREWYLLPLLAAALVLTLSRLRLSREGPA